MNHGNDDPSHDNKPIHKNPAHGTSTASGSPSGAAISQEPTAALSRNPQHRTDLMPSRSGDHATATDLGRKVSAQRALTKADLVDSVYEIVGGDTKKEATEIIEGLFHVLKSTLASGENVKVSGFGNWVVKQKKPRLGRNPQTGEPMTITARKVISFKPSQILKTAIDPD